jgi:hypothetical protein
LNAAKLARTNIADTAAAVFVDAMRLFNVASGDKVKEVNRPRYDEFVDMADQHFRDFRIQVTRLIEEPSSELIRMCAKVESGLSWALTRLRREPVLDRPWRDFVLIMAELAERATALAEPATPNYSASRQKEVLSALQQALHQFELSASQRTSDQYVSGTDIQMHVDESEESGRCVVHVVFVKKGGSVTV